MEQAAVHAWPAAQTQEIDGWLWRATGGGSRRANSVSTLHFNGADLAASVARAEALYARRDVPAQFCITDVSEPAGLAEQLSARGYRVEERCTTLTKPVAIGLGTPGDVSFGTMPDAAWLDVYLGAVSASRRAVAARILDRVPEPRAFFACKRSGGVISVGLGVQWRDIIVVQCMATQAAARRQGGAGAILAAIEAWAGEQGARRLCLGAVADNVAAQELYRNRGFACAGTYRHFIR
jgi:N-acetylglutamate synthase